VQVYLSSVGATVVEVGKNNFSNIKKIEQIGNPFWDKTEISGLSNLVARNLGGGWLEKSNGDAFVNMCSYSYLGLDSHPAILEGAINAVKRSGTLNSTTSRVRIRSPLLDETEEALSRLFSAEALTTVSCASAAAGILPLIASGMFTDSLPPVMAFDKNAHFCLTLMKSVCADESSVVTLPHNDLNAIEDLCKKHKRVCYVADGVYSTGGRAPVKDLLALQHQYGLFLFFDEAHGISAYGEQGRGLVLQEMGAINERTIIIASLNKGFGASGGAIFLAEKAQREKATRYGGPLSWSQRINTAGLGAVLASVDIHQSPELNTLQCKLQDNINSFDSLIMTEQAGDRLPIRLISMKDEASAIIAAQRLLEKGFYTSPLFFPVVARNKAGLRVMMRANLTRQQIEEFCALVSCLKREL
jgi:7-keto-8-aminopelargonate synthetase-like enzyme